MDAKVAQAGAARIDVGRIDVGEVSLGDIDVGSLMIDDARIGIRAGRAVLQDVHVRMRLEFTVDWWVGVDLEVAEFSRHGTDFMGVVTIPFDLGDWEVPSLREIDLRIAQLAGSHVRATADPVMNLRLRRLAVEDAHISDASVPRTGFTISGLGLSSLAVDDVHLPAMSVRGGSAALAHGDPLTIPSLRLRGLSLPSAAASDISSGVVDLPLQRRERMQVGRLRFPFLRLTLFVRPAAATRIGRMQISDVRSTLSADAIELSDVTVPYALHNITLADLGINDVDIPSISLT